MRTSRIQMTEDDVVVGKKCWYFWRFLPWEEPAWEHATILGTTPKRIRILHENSPLGDVIKLVKITSLYREVTLERQHPS